MDARSDIFAFGAVLYEMATGRRAFDGKSQLADRSAILDKEPEPIGRCGRSTPPALERVVHRCLAKEPDDRWQTARDLGLELKWIAGQRLQVAVGRRSRAGREAVGGARILGLGAPRSARRRSPAWSRGF